MNKILNHIDFPTLKRTVTLRFTLLLSLFLLLLIASYTITSKAITEIEDDSILLNIAGRQRMLIRQYVSEVSQVLVSLASEDFEKIIHDKKKSDLTLKLFEQTHLAFIHGGEIFTYAYAFTQADNFFDKIDISTHNNKFFDDMKKKHIMAILPLKNKVIRNHLDHVYKEWLELKRITSLSLRADANSVSKNRYVGQLLDQATKSANEMDHVVQLMQHSSETKLRRLNTMQIILMIIGSMLFFILIYFVYSRIVSPLDISIKELQKTTADLENEKIQAEKANHAKSEFLSHMSHELRTPLNAILGFGQLLKLGENKFSETQNENIKEILDAGYHLLSLINDLLDLAKIESGKLEFSMENVFVDDLLQQCLSLISTQAESRHIELIDHASNKGHIIRADFTRLKQIFLNLLSNAVKYNQDHGSITLHSEMLDKQFLRISVTDTGNGLTKADIAKLFTSFERLNTDMSIEGTGIGLNISKHLVELMNGTIGVTSTPGQGSTFWVEFACTENT